MSAKPLKLFVVKDKKNPNAVPRLIKAATKGQVSKFLANSTSIEPGTPLDVAEIMVAHSLVIEDASAIIEDFGSADDSGEPSGTGGVVSSSAGTDSSVSAEA